MVSGGHRTGRTGATSLSLLSLLFLEDSLAKHHVVVSSHRFSAQAHRPRFKSGLQGYSHINIQQRTTAATPPAETDKKEEDFIRKESVQEEIKEHLLYINKLAFTPELPTRPRTFAEATMSTRTRSHGGRKDSVKGSDATLSGPVSLESLGPFKFTFKRKKKANKWSPFDLGGGDSTSEVGSMSEADATFSRAVSPDPQSIFGSASTHSSPQKLLSTPLILKFSPVKDKESIQLTEEEAEVSNTEGTHQTPTQNSFEFPSAVRAVLDFSTDTDSFLDSIPYTYSLDEVDSNTSDTQSTKDRTEIAMASITEAFGTRKFPKVGEDTFDSVEWDPSLPSASAPESPEIVPVPPKPVAYTTVGSIVKNAPPLLTAPNRIQREGAGRKALLPFTNRPLMPIRHQESSYFFSRDPPPPLNMQKSMQYSQQLAQSPIRFQQAQQPMSLQSSRSTLSSLQQISLSEDEQKVLMRIGPQTWSGNFAGSPAPRNTSSRLFTSAITSGTNPTAETPLPKLFTKTEGSLYTFLPSDLFGEDGQRRSTALSGLEKMQTIQRLAKFENPMQELARSRLSALSVTNCLGRNVANPNGAPTASSSPIPDLASYKGELDLSYQFPPPDFGTSLTSQSNSLIDSYDTAALQMATYNRSSGVPQPLTAGPPGQRQCPTAVEKASAALKESRQFGGEATSLTTTYAEYLAKTASHSQLYYSSLNQQTITNSLSLNLNIAGGQVATPVQQERAAAYEGEVVGSRLVDTLPISVVSQYYPYGIPSNMTGKYEPPSSKVMMGVCQSSGGREPVTAKEKAAAREDELKNWFYSGHQQFSKTIDDHINDMEDREQKKSPFGNIGESKDVPPPAQNRPIAIEEMKEMTIAEATKPLLNAAFGTLLSYADQSSESRTHLSGWEKSPDLLIDSSDKGNMTCFGEDWGPPPDRVGRTSKYQPTFRNWSTPHWA